MREAEPRRMDTETRRCIDCNEETVHLVLEWSFSTTTECRACGLICQGEPR